jgi:hypothetical protein
MPCEQFAPLGVCSDHGRCLSLATGAEVGADAWGSGDSYCACDSGWVGDGDLISYPLSNCITHTTALRVLYGIVCAVAALCTVYNTTAVLSAFGGCNRSFPFRRFGRYPGFRAMCSEFFGMRPMRIVFASAIVSISGVIAAALKLRDSPAYFGFDVAFDVFSTIAILTVWISGGDVVLSFLNGSVALLRLTPHMADAVKQIIERFTSSLYVPGLSCSRALSSQTDSLSCTVSSARARPVECCFRSV